MRSIYLDERWGRLQQQKEQGEYVHYTFEQEGMRLIYPFIKRIAGTVDGITYYDLVTPRGESGIWIEGGEPALYPGLIAAFEEDFGRYCQKEHIVAELIRFCPWQAFQGYFREYYRIEQHGTTYYNDLRHDFYELEFPRHERRDIARAARFGFTIEIGQDESFIDDFLRLYRFTENLRQVSEYYRLDREFIASYLRYLPEEAYFIQASYEGVPVASSLMLLGPDIAHGEFVGVDPAYRPYSLNKLVMYHSELFAARQGRKIFDMGGAREGSSLAKYKERRAQPLPYWRGTRIRDPFVYQRLVEQSGNTLTEKDGFFPAYRRPQLQPAAPQPTDPQLIM